MSNIVYLHDQQPCLIPRHNINTLRQCPIRILYALNYNKSIIMLVPALTHSLSSRWMLLPMLTKYLIHTSLTPLTNQPTFHPHYQRNGSNNRTKQQHSLHYYIAFAAAAASVFLQLPLPPTHSHTERTRKRIDKQTMNKNNEKHVPRRLITKLN